MKLMSFKTQADIWSLKCEVHDKTESGHNDNLQEAD